MGGCSFGGTCCAGSSLLLICFPFFRFRYTAILHSGMALSDFNASIYRATGYARLRRGSTSAAGLVVLHNKGQRVRLKRSNSLAFMICS